MKKKPYLFDTHALVFWNNKESVSEEFISFFDNQAQKGHLYVSSISFWEIALLVREGRISMSDVHAWKNEILSNTNIRLIEPSASEMINSTLLPDYHKDPFDRLIVAQADQNGLLIVTKDINIDKYEVETFWM
ncbi:MAG: type II toxin-antitoxin system VapC family toxin [Deltaproteobacteria bacterium]|nr:type II toxin-antitoxin system VapC family toxin [Deltaproteobacteria bacterium]MBW2047722.1 type II toxin-antitoxin system VapC family toxin [Deltaproteobacteria bacterium]MBW2110365.1 type II toxin-antitoxin system VapC family toxin [Deltaproteobacteria bacterium]MBW2352263.1 type II toxin-antitoxin system VapC family toxin [Deltaproteobacteria bacterium]